MVVVSFGGIVLRKAPRLRLLTLLLFGVAIPGFAQAPSASGPIFQSNTELVQVSVIAVDQHGQPVADLRQEDFQVFDNGKPQPLRVFVGEKPGNSRPSPPPPGTFTNQYADYRSRSDYTVILLDWLNTGFAAQGYVRERLLRMLRAIAPDDKVALYVNEWNLRVVHEFTSDPGQLAREVASLPAFPGYLTPSQLESTRLPGPNPGVFDASIGPGYSPQVPGASRGIVGDEFRRAEETGKTLDGIAEHLAGVPGRKNLVWIASLFYRAPPKSLSNANISIYPVDARGLFTSGSLFNRTIEQSAMHRLADQTGGRSFYDRNDLDAAMREALDDGRVSYTLGFYQPSQSGPGLHKIDVRVRRAGVRLRYRQSYHADDPKSKKRDARIAVADALTGPIDATAIPLTATAARTPSSLVLNLKMGAESLNLESPLGASNGGTVKAQVDVLARFADAGNRQVGDISKPQTISFDLTQSSLERARQAGFAHKMELLFPTGATQVRVMVRDDQSGRVGTLSIPLDQVPAAQ